LIKVCRQLERQSWFHTLSIVLICTLLSVILHPGSWVSDFYEGQVMIGHGKSGRSRVGLVCVLNIGDMFMNFF